MKFACPNCSKKYNLGEDKLAARDNVRLKCRQCGEQISVKEGGRLVISPLTKADLGRASVAPPALPSIKPPEESSSKSEDEAEAKAETATVPLPETAGPRPGAPPPSRPSPSLPPPIPPTRGSSSLTPPPPPSVAPKAAAAPAAEQADEKLEEAIEIADAEAGEFPKPGASVDPTAETPAVPEGVAAAELVATSASEAAASSAGSAAIETAESTFDAKSLGASQGFLEDLIDKMKDRGLDEKKRLLIALGVGWLLGLVIGLIF